MKCQSWLPSKTIVASMRNKISDYCLLFVCYGNLYFFRFKFQNRKHNRFIKESVHIIFMKIRHQAQRFK